MYDSSRYACMECNFATGDHRAFKKHLSQCTKYINATRANELALKHKCESRNPGTATTTLGDLCVSKLARTNSYRGLVCRWWGGTSGIWRYDEDESENESDSDESEGGLTVISEDGEEVDGDVSR